MRAIAVLRLPIRILSSVLAQRFEIWASLNDDQAGSRSNRNIFDQIFIVVSLCEKALIKNEQMYVVFIDNSSTFDTVSQENFWNIFINKIVSASALRFLKKQYGFATNQIKWMGDVSVPYKLEREFSNAAHVHPSSLRFVPTVWDSSYH